ncbi:MAG: HAMP domain-containing histidine kinase [Candidatus Symbiothrix sp.]|jgi:signal transduction histidine kinase|nr:HAMP domain-containing histidine kinase [Candidatus Symbiothrix sp.]
MKKSTIWLLAGVMIFAFTGLLYLQINYILIILNTQESQFENAVRRSLYQVSYNLELDETEQYLAEQIFAFDKKSLQRKPQDASQLANKNQQRLALGASHQALTTKTIEIHVRGLSSSFGKNDINTASQRIQTALEDQYFYQQNLLEQVIQNAMKASEKPIEERVDFTNLGGYIRSELVNNDLILPFVFAVLDRNKRVVYKSQGYSVENLKNVYSQILFPKDPGNRLYTLQVAFPTQRKYVLDSISFIVPSIIFTFVLLVVFITTMSIVFRQKRLTEMKSDFINNMTHELKTPVASISLAAQTLNDTDVSQSPQLMEHAKQVINDESKRLGFLVDKVLQMSLFESKATQFKMAKLDANDLIASIASTFALRVENAGGTVDIDLEAMDSTIVVDKMHFTNVLFNLMENAVKYRNPDVPLELMAHTANAGNKIVITIEDNGLGIKKEDAKKIFEKFYRVHTGNRHDVKGFGLGLAYVKRIITELDGTIKVESELGVGTKFIISLPYIIDN